MKRFAHSAGLGLALCVVAPAASPLTFDPDAGVGSNNLSFACAAAVNNEYVRCVNDTPVAIQAMAAAEHFVSPMPGSTLEPSRVGSLSDAVANEPARHGTDTLAHDEFSADTGPIAVTVTPAISEPRTAVLMLAGLALMGLLKFSSQADRRR